VLQAQFKALMNVLKHKHKHYAFKTKRLEA